MLKQGEYSYLCHSSCYIITPDTQTPLKIKGVGGRGGVLIHVTYSDEQLEINFLGCIHI